MLAHGLFDSTSVALAWWALHTQGEKALTTQPTGFHVGRDDVIALSLGAAAVVAGAVAFRAALRRPPNASPLADDAHLPAEALSK